MLAVSLGSSTRFFSKMEVISLFLHLQTSIEDTHLRNSVMNVRSGYWSDTSRKEHFLKVVLN